MELKSIASDRSRSMTREVEVVLGDETLHAVIRPLGLSPSTQLSLMQTQEAIEGAEEITTAMVAKALEAMPLALSEMVESWDLTVDGEPLPTTFDSLKHLSMDVLQVLVVSIQEAASASPFEETS